MAEILDDLDWQGKVFSSGWVTPHGGELKSVEPATGDVLARVGLATRPTSPRRPRRPGGPSPTGPPSPARSGRR